MKTKSIIALPVCVLCAGLFAASPAAANEPMVVEGQHIAQERVSFADLDLRNWGAQAALRRRVRNASHNVCVAMEGPITDMTYSLAGTRDAGMTCTDVTYNHARTQILAAIARAKSGELLATGLVITARAR
jgi:UrcA family protein